MAKLRKILAFILAISLFPTLAKAQAASLVTLQTPNLEQFPRITTYMDVREAQGLFVSGLQPADITILEDNTAILPGEVAELRVGAQLVVAVNPGDAFAIRDAQGLTRFDYLSQALQAWAEMLPGDNPDSLNLVTPEGILVNQVSDPAAWLGGWQAYAPDLQNALPSLDVLSRAIDTAGERPPQHGMGRAVLFLTPTMSPETIAVLQDLADRASQSGVRIHVWLVDSPSLFESESAAALQALAAQTGGSFFAYSGSEPLPDINAAFEHSRWTYLVSYRSKIQSGGDHELGVVIQTPAGEITSNLTRFQLALQPPNPIFLAPPSQIVRAIPENTEIDVANLEPTQYQFEIIIEYPDTISRAIVETRLYANGVPIASNTAPPFEFFTLDLTAFDASETVVLRVEVIDELGLTGSTIDTPVQITVQRPEQSIDTVLSRNIPIIAGGLVFITGGILLMILVLAGRIRPRRIGERRRKRAAYKDPVTQPVQALEEETIPSPSRLAQFTRRLPATRLNWPQRQSRSQPTAYLVPLTASGEPQPEAIFSITTQEITFGSDPGQAILTIDQPAVEALHARLWRDEQGVFRLADENSVAGTWINYAPVSKEGSKVEHGDLLHIAKVGFRFTLSKPTRPRRPSVTQVKERE